VAGKKSTVTLAKNLIFCVPHRQKGVNQTKIYFAEGNLKKKIT
jgi:hypothetical protein